MANGGLYRTEGGFYVSVDPTVTGGLFAVESTAPPLDGLWITNRGDELVRLRDETVTRYDLFDVPFGTQDLSASTDGTALLWVGSRGEPSGPSEVEVLRADGDDALARTPTPLGPIEGRTRATYFAGQWWVGGSALWASADPERSWTRYPVPSAVVDLGPGPDGRLWFAGDSGVYATDGETAERVDASGADRLVFAPNGDVWALSGSEARRWRATSAAPTFAADVLPWLQATGCVDCHAGPTVDFRSFEDFSAIAADALARVASGDMPRCGAELCPPEAQLTPDAYRVLELWLQTGLNE